MLTTLLVIVTVLAVLRSFGNLARSAVEFLARLVSSGLLVCVLLLIAVRSWHG